MSFPPLRAAFYIATSGAIVNGGATAMGHGLPTVVTAGLFAGYLGMVAAAIMEPRTQIFSDVIARVPDGFALTFDDGPHPEYTRQIMDVLDARGAKATFFMIGRKMATHPDVVREVVARGHAVGAHGYTHHRLYSLKSTAWLAHDADQEEAIWEQTVGELPVLFRPPIGLMNPRIAGLVDERARHVVGWTIRPRDGIARTTPEQVVERVVPKLREGAIVLLHDTGENDTRSPAALAALPGILDGAARLGLSARTVPVPQELVLSRSST